MRTQSPGITDLPADGLMDDTSLRHWGDVLTIVLYFAIVLAVGLWSVCRRSRGGVTGYFLAGRNMDWWPVGASLFASNIGSEHFIGLAGTAAASGIAVVIYEWMSLPLVMLLSWLFLPVYITAGVYTLPEYLERRFGGPALRIYLSCLAMVLYVVTKIAVCIYAGALFIQLALGWDMYLSIGVLLVITCIYTALGGLAAVIYTDTLQTIIMTIGAVVLSVISFIQIGGFEGLQTKYFEAIPSIRNNETTCGVPREDAFHLFRHPLYGDHPWPGILLQASVGCLWYWCADQVIVQRALAAKSVAHAKGGAILAGYLKILPLFLMIFPGMISRVLYPDEVGCTDPEVCNMVCNNPVGCSNIAYPKLVMTLLPVGLRGLLVAVMMSAIMSSLTSIFNSASTLLTMDLWRRVRPRASQRELLIVGRVCILFLCVISILWVPLVQSSAGGQLFVYIQAVQGYLGTPIGLVFLMAVFWERMNEKGALCGLLTGHLCGTVRMVLDFVYPAPACGEPDTRPDVIAKLHYTYFSQLNLVITAIVIVVVSMVTKPQTQKQLEGVTWWTRKPVVKESEIVPLEQMESDDTGAEGADLHLQKVTNGATDIKIQSSDNEKPEQPEVTNVWTRWVQFLCGMKGTDQNQEQDARMQQGQCAKMLHENPFWSKVLNANAVMALMVLVFLMGYYH